MDKETEEYYSALISKWKDSTYGQYLEKFLERELKKGELSEIFPGGGYDIKKMNNNDFVRNQWYLESEDDDFCNYFNN